MSKPRVKVLFGSGPRNLLPFAISKMRDVAAELPLVVVSEFEPEGDATAEIEWIPYHYKRSSRENLALIRARLEGREIGLSASIFAPKNPYPQLNRLAFLLAPTRCLVFNQNLDHFLLRPNGVLARFVFWRVKNSLLFHLFHGGFFYTWYWRIRQPGLLRRPALYRAALLSGWLARLLRSRSTIAASPQPSSGLPQGISVVIPTRNGRDLLAAILPFVFGQLDSESSEVIIVDNGSDDGSVPFLNTAFPGVLVEHSAEPLSFAKAVNRGIARAHFSHTCLLNNDMVIEPGFFNALASAFTEVPDLFCSTAQIFLPEGERREETGKAVFPLERPREGFPARCEIPIEGEDHTWVLYGSGGCSLYDTAKLRALGGVGEVFAPAYVEDMDLGFRAWRLNWPTVYSAGARVLHHHRTTTSRYYSERQLTLVLERNYLRFLARSITDRELFRALWFEAVYRINLSATHDDHYIDILQTALPAPAWVESQPAARLPEREILALGSGNLAIFAGKPRGSRPLVLIVSPYVPYPLSHGGAVRMYNLMRRGAQEFDQVLICFTDELRPVPPEILDICAEVVYVRREGTHAVPSSDRPDAVEEFDSPVMRAALHQAVKKWKPAIAQLEFTQMAQYAEDCAPAKTLLVEHDITLDLYEQLLRQNDDWETRRQYEKWVHFERDAWGRIHRIVTMSEKDRLAVGRPNAVALPNGVDLQRFRPAATEPEPRRILFISSFAHLPNVLALDFFLRECWPLLEPLEPALHIIAGNRPDYFLDRYKDRVQLNLDRKGIELEAFVPDVRPAYERATVVIAPLLASAGTNIKIVEAMGMAKAIVSTPAGINGLNELEDGRDVLVVTKGDEMARAIAGLFANSSRRKELERAARRTAEEKFDWDVIARTQAQIYRSLF